MTWFTIEKLGKAGQEADRPAICWCCAHMQALKIEAADRALHQSALPHSQMSSCQTGMPSVQAIRAGKHALRLQELAILERHEFLEFGHISDGPADASLAFLCRLHCK